MIRFVSILLVVFHATLEAQQAILLETEDGHFEGVDTSSAIQGFSGQGYIVGLDSIGDYLELDFVLTSPDLYRIELGYRCTSPPNSRSDLWLDGAPLTAIHTAQTSLFQEVNLGTFDLSSGQHTLRILHISARLEPDFVRLTPIDLIEPITLGQGMTRIEAEEGLLFGTQVEFARSGFSGDGYVTNFDMADQDKVVLQVFSEQTALFDLTIGFASPFGYKENYLRINDGNKQSIAFIENVHFSEVDVNQIQLPAGESRIEIIHFWGYFDLDYLQFKRVVGQAPQAKILENILRNDSDGDGWEWILLDGNASVDPDGEIVEMHWYAGDTLIAAGTNQELALPLGTHFIELMVTDNDGNTDRAELVAIIADLNDVSHNRLSVQDGRAQLFMSGINLAWTTNSNYANDLNHYDEDRWIQILDDIQSAGANAVRWWLHTNGARSPEFGADGKVVGLAPETLSIMENVLDLAMERGIMVSLCLWSFDMLQDQGQNLAATRALLEDSLATDAYLQNALIPMVMELGDHPAIMTWEILNEAEGMTWEFGWSDERTSMLAVQRFVNRCTGAIHRTGTKIPVSTGVWTLRQATDSSGFFNFYSDDRLVEAGGDPDGTLDMIQIHYYDPVGVDASPFHFPASRWGINKPIIIGEFPADGITGFSVEECYEFPYRLGYAGALSWSYSDRDFGGLPASIPGIRHLFDSYPEDIVVPDTSIMVWTNDLIEFFEVGVYPNPMVDFIWIEFKANRTLTPYSFTLVSIDGLLVQEGVLGNDQKNLVSTKTLAPGTYIIHIHNNSFSLNKLLTKIN